MTFYILPDDMIVNLNHVVSIDKAKEDNLSEKNRFYVDLTLAVSNGGLRYYFDTAEKANTFRETLLYRGNHW